MTRAPASEALSRVESVESASITKISSAQATESQASLMFDSSLKVMIVALIFIRFAEAQNKFAIASVSVSCLSNRELKRQISFADLSYGTLGDSTTILLERNVVEVARWRSASALL